MAPWAMSLLGAVLPILCLCSCGGTGVGTPGAPSARQTQEGRANGGAGTEAVVALRSDPSEDDDNDGDEDGSNHGPPGTPDDDVEFLRRYGRPADPALIHAATELVRSYYAGLASDDGDRACALVQASLIGAFAAGSHPSEQDGVAGCIKEVSLLYRQERRQLEADEIRTMRVTALRVKGSVGLAVVGFKNAPSREILLEREEGKWTMGALSDSPMP